MANVFISHRSADAAEAKRLANDILRNGHVVWLDEWEIDVGKSIIGAMEEGLTGATYLVLCLSTAGVLAPWISREWMPALARQLDGFAVRLLPVRLTGGNPPPPAILADLKCADLVKNWDAGLAALLKAIR